MPIYYIDKNDEINSFDIDKDTIDYEKLKIILDDDIYMTKEVLIKILKKICQINTNIVI